MFDLFFESEGIKRQKKIKFWAEKNKEISSFKKVLTEEKGGHKMWVCKRSKPKPAKTYFIV